MSTSLVQTKLKEIEEELSKSFKNEMLLLRSALSESQQEVAGLQEQKNDLQEQTNELQQQVQSLTTKNAWGTIFIVGAITNIRKSRGNMHIITVKDVHGFHSVQCWGYANEQIIQEQFTLGEYICCIAYPHYYKMEGVDKISFKTQALTRCSSLMVVNGVITSEWYKGKVFNKDYQTFVVKDQNNNGKVIHCHLKKTSTLMRAIKKGANVRVTGTPNIQFEDDKSHRLTLVVTNLEVL